MNRISAILLFGLLLLSSCTQVPTTQGASVQAPSFALQPVPATVPVPTATIVPCDPATAEYCIVDGHFMFQNPLGPDSVLTIARSYAYGSTANGQRDPHHGVDLESKEGAPVYASAEGVVIFAEPDHEDIFAPWKDYYGNLIVIQHENDLYTLYGHLSQIHVTAGDVVDSGDLIGEVGHTGVAIGSHLHFEVRNGGDGTNYFSTENPELWLVLQDGMGALSVNLDASELEKVQRQLVILRYAAGTNVSEKKYYVATYPGGFEYNEEDLALSNLPPGRYRIAFSDEGNLRERVVEVEAGKLTQVVFDGE